MKNLTIKLAIILFFSSVFAGSAMAGSDDTDNDKKEDFHILNIGIPTHAMVSIAGSNGTTVDFSAEAPEIAGNSVTFKQTSNSQLYLNYSSIVTSGKTNTIAAKVSGLVDGLNINLNVGTNAIGEAKGATGTGQSQTLGTQGKTVVSGIGSCYTGSGSGKGHKLEYSIEVNQADYSKIAAKNNDITVTYTITEF